MYIPIIKNSPKPAYQQITDSIRKRVLTGELKPNEDLPSIRQLAQDTQVSVITIRRAYSDLENEGLIYSRPGLGYYVAQLTEEQLEELKLEWVMPLLEEVALTAAELGLKPARLLSLLDQLLSDSSNPGERKKIDKKADAGEKGSDSDE
jgi:GntR family transcriptional regulator